MYREITSALRLRRQIWTKLAGDWRPDHLDRFEAGEISLDELPSFSDRMLKRQSHKRTLVRINP